MRVTLAGWQRGAALVALLAFGPVAAGGSALAQTGPATGPVELGLMGRVEHPRTLALDDLKALPPVTVEVAHGEHKASYTGTLLWTLVSAATPVDDAGKGGHLQHVLLARGQDGYAVALAVGELDPRLENKQVVVAYEQDGKPLPALHLAVPGDAHAARSVRDLVSVEVR